MRIGIVFVFVLFVTACAGGAYLPGNPGSASSDISGRDVRDAWLAEHPDIDEETRVAIETGVFIPGMTLETRDLITNSDRRDATGNGYWRSRELGDEVRFQWFVGGEREPFKDGRGELVCELIYADQLLAEVRYCGSDY